MSLLKIQNLSKIFGSKKAVNNVSLSLEKGEILAILGESGSGKTSLLHLIAALSEPHAGILLLENKRIIPPSEKLIAGHADIKLVRQDYGLFPNMSIRENIAYELRYYEENYRNKRVDKLLKLSGLQQVQTQLPRQVSGGEQQRAVIVKAIAEKPKLLLLDEPFSHLDSLNKRKLKSEILGIIKEEAITCLFVTHDVSDAYEMADRLAIMHKGKIVQIDTPEKIYKNPKTEYIAQITGELIKIKQATISNLDLEKYNILKKNASENVVFLRPEQINIVENEGIKAIVKGSKFLGNCYEISLEINDEIVKMHSFEKIEVGKEVKIQLKALS